MSKISHERKEVLPDPNDGSIKDSDFVDQVAWLIGGSRCCELLKRVNSRHDLIRAAEQLLHMDGVRSGGGSAIVSGKDLAAQSFA